MIKKATEDLLAKQKQRGSRLSTNHSVERVSKPAGQKI